MKQTSQTPKKPLRTLDRAALEQVTGGTISEITLPPLDGGSKDSGFTPTRP